MASGNRDVRVVREACLADEMVIVDGFCGSAKSMLGPILGSFERIEKQRLELIYEHLCMLEYFGKIDESAAVAMMRIYASQAIYDMMISRMINFRYTDDTGVFRNPRPWKYLRRLFMKDGDGVLERIQEEKPVLQLATHQLLGFIRLAFKAFGPRLKVIEMERHPLDIIDFWMKKNWGARFGRDPRDFTIWIEHGGEVTPAFVTEGPYDALNPVDRILESLQSMERRNEETLKTLSPEERSRILFVPFEKFVTDPEPHLRRIEAFLGTKRTRLTAAVLKKQKCPRRLDPESRNVFRKTVESRAGERGRAVLDSLCAAYERKHGLLH